MQSTLSYYVERIQGVSTQTLSVPPQNSTSASGSQTIRFTLPSSTLMNARSLKVFFSATTTGSGARLPPVSGLLDSYEVQAGGVSIADSCHYTNLLTRAKACLEGSRADSLLGHSEMVREVSYVDGTVIAGVGNEVYDDAGGATQFCLDLGNEIPGFFSSCEPSVVDTAILPPITLILYLASNAVLPSVAGIGLSNTSGATISHAGVGGCAFQLSNISLQCEVLSLASSVYDELIARRMQATGYVEMCARQFSSFPDSHNGSTKLSSASQSLDKVWVVQRPKDPEGVAGLHPVPGHKISGGFVSTASASATALTLDLGAPTFDRGGVFDTSSEKYVAKALQFKEGLPVTSGGVPVGSAKYQLRVNGSMLPAQPFSCEQMLGMSLNSVDRAFHSKMTLAQYKDSNCVQCWRFGMPQDSTRVMDGLDNRSLNTSISWETTGLDSNIPVIAFTESTSSIRVGPQRSIQTVL